MFFDLFCGLENMSIAAGLAAGIARYLQQQDSSLWSLKLY